MTSQSLTPEQIHYEKIKESLEDVIDLAEGYGGQASRAQRILLSIYDPDGYQMSAGDFTCLDSDHLYNLINILYEYGKRHIDLFSLLDGSEERVFQLSKCIPPTKI